MRCFIAIDLPENIKESLAKLQENFKQFANVRLVNPKNIHLTLKFLGEIDETKKQKIEKVLTNLSKKYTSFSCTPQKTGTFPSKKYIKVIWVGLSDSEKILQIQKDLDQELEKIGFKKEKAFSTHITIARVKGPQNKEEIIQTIERSQDYQDKPFEVVEIKLMKSTLTKTGPIYEVLGAFKLGR